MYDFLVNHALANVWCSPEQDYQFIWAPAKLTGINGSVGTLRLLWDFIPLPTPAEHYHVYQIGQNHHSLLGLFPERNVWHCAARVMERQKIDIKFYGKSGIQLARAHCWILITDDQNVIIAVEDQPAIELDLNTEELYVRLYSNAYFKSARAIPLVDKILVAGGFMSSTDDIIKLQNLRASMDILPGSLSWVHNGKVVGGLNIVLGAIKVKDYLEFVYDTSVMGFTELPVAELATFDSLIDLQRKYLYHESLQTGNFNESLNTIEYADDVDVYLIKRGNGTGFHGVYYHKNLPSNHRMVTHNDYSFSVQAVAAFLDDNEFFDSVDGVITMRLLMRKSGYKRPLVNEHHRIKELYKLSDSEIRAALLGINSTVPEWRADYLEASGYTKIMRLRGEEVTRELVQNAYGYNAISKLIADTPSFVFDEGGHNVAKLPIGLQTLSTVYEYNAAGTMLGFQRHTDGESYYPISSDCAMVEALVGSGGVSPATEYDRSESVYNSKYNYRFYTCPIRNGVPTFEWTDVTGTPSYTITGDLIKWNIDKTRLYSLVKNDSKFISYSFTLDRVDGILKFDIINTEVFDGVSRVVPVTIPTGEVDIWLNGKYLIENLDYYINTFPKVVIVNKSYLKEDGGQVITVRAMGFCNRKLERTAPSEFGFIDHGTLSRNNHYDLRDDKVMRFVANGQLCRRTDLKFAEDTGSVVSPTIPNGAPYVIEDIVVPLHDLINGDTYALREQSIAVDKRVSDYLTMKFPQQPFTTPNIIVKLHEVYSPFCSKIMHDMIEGFIGGPEIQGRYSDADIVTWLADYEYLLKYDPCLRDASPDYVIIHPHNLFTVTELNLYQYTFLERIIKLYLRERVDLTRFVQLRPYR